MPKSMRGALGSSLRAEEEAVRSRFERAENVLARTDFSASNVVGQPHLVALPAADVREEEGERVKRDSFTMPVVDHELIAMLQKRCMRSAINATKSEILRAGLAALCAMGDTELTDLVGALPKVKTGRRPRRTI